MLMPYQVASSVLVTDPVTRTGPFWGITDGVRESMVTASGASLRAGVRRRAGVAGAVRTRQGTAMVATTAARAGMAGRGAEHGVDSSRRDLGASGGAPVGRGVIGD